MVTEVDPDEVPVVGVKPVMIGMSYENVLVGVLNCPPTTSCKG